MPLFFIPKKLKNSVDIILSGIHQNSLILIYNNSLNNSLLAPIRQMIINADPLIELKLFQKKITLIDNHIIKQAALNIGNF